MTIFEILHNNIYYPVNVLAVILVILTCVKKIVFIKDSHTYSTKSSIMTKVQKFVIDCVEFQVDRVGNVRRDL